MRFLRRLGRAILRFLRWVVRAKRTPAEKGPEVTARTARAAKRRFIRDATHSFWSILEPGARLEIYRPGRGKPSRTLTYNP